MFEFLIFLFGVDFLLLGCCWACLAVERTTLTTSPAIATVPIVVIPKAARSTKSDPILSHLRYLRNVFIRTASPRCFSKCHCLSPISKSMFPYYPATYC